jgi:hypothetical protein
MNLDKRIQILTRKLALAKSPRAKDKLQKQIKILQTSKTVLESSQRRKNQGSRSERLESHSKFLNTLFDQEA